MATPKGPMQRPLHGGSQASKPPKGRRSIKNNLWNLNSLPRLSWGSSPSWHKNSPALGASDVKPGRRMVSFRGDKEMMYRANFQLRPSVS